MIAQELPHTTARLEWLGACVPRPDVVCAEWMARPFLLNFGGEVWSCATDGTGLVGLKGSEPGLTQPADMGPMVAAVFATEPANRLVVPWSDIDAFLSEATVERSVVCRKCSGAAPEPTECGRCSGDGEIECGECGHDTECPDCLGDGYLGDCKGCEGDKTSRPDPKPGQVAPGIAIDRNILKRILGPFRPERITVGYSNSLDPVVLEDDSREWRIVIMPMREQPLDELPVLFATGAH